MSAEATGHVFRTSPYKGATFIVHVAVADSVNDLNDYELWATQTRVADKARVSRETASRSMATLVDDGHVILLEDNAKSGKPNRYRFVFKVREGVTSDHTSDGVGVIVDHRGCDDTSQEGVTSDHTEPKREQPKRTQGTLSSPPTAKQCGSAGAFTYPAEFEEAWSTYPRNKGSKNDAYESWRSRILEAKALGIPLDRRANALLVAATNYAADCVAGDRPLDKIMHGSTFWGPRERWRPWVKPVAAADDRPDEPWSSSRANNG